MDLLVGDGERGGVGENEEYYHSNSTNIREDTIQRKL